MTRLRLPLGMTFLLAIAASAPALGQPPALRATVEGAVQRPGVHEFPAGSRLADAALAAMPDPQAYPLGAALLRREAVIAQTRAKAGLLYDLQALQSQARTGAEVAVAADRLRQWLGTLPVTGRVRNRLEPRALEADPRENRPLADGDRFLYPLRPDSIRVVGLVAQACELEHVPLRDAKAYLHDCPPAPLSDRDWLYVIQPDGHVERLGIAAWNRSAPHPLAPGAVLYVPLSERALGEIDAGFNAALADFIATQPLPVAGAAR
ncbi:capsule biosynthesis GfcC family protein [Luteimonas suaedae]|uniref:capsule biosynthesis GfcC family protein n=1 Tax=Luteimonas suaedae TaxID=2605430 RepID=UPI00210528B5|nr:capsule biosynthesis GfcC family protein [Luteimonas suaedae]